MSCFYTEIKKITPVNYTANGDNKSLSINCKILINIDIMALFIPNARGRTTCLELNAHLNCWYFFLFSDSFRIVLIYFSYLDFVYKHSMD